jgi:hypothetical protein
MLLNRRGAEYAEKCEKFRLFSASSAARFFFEFLRLFKDSFCDFLHAIALRNPR